MMLVGRSLKVSVHVVLTENATQFNLGFLDFGLKLQDMQRIWLAPFSLLSPFLLSLLFLKLFIS